MDSLNSYCHIWKLKVNCKTTVYSFFTKSPKVAKRDLSISLAGNTLQRVENPTYLGVELDTQVTRKNHVRNLTKKLNKRMNILKRLSSTSWGADKDTLRQLYIGYVRSALDYNLALQNICRKLAQKSLDKIKHHAARFISGAMKAHQRQHAK